MCLICCPGNSSSPTKNLSGDLAFTRPHRFKTANPGEKEFGNKGCLCMWGLNFDEKEKHAFQLFSYALMGRLLGARYGGRGAVVVLKKIGVAWGQGLHLPEMYKQAQPIFLLLFVSEENCSQQPRKRRSSTLPRGSHLNTLLSTFYFCPKRWSDYSMMPRMPLAHISHLLVIVQVFVFCLPCLQYGEIPGPGTEPVPQLPQQ